MNMDLGKTLERVGSLVVLAWVVVIGFGKLERAVTALESRTGAMEQVLQSNYRSQEAMTAALQELSRAVAQLNNRSR